MAVVAVFPKRAGGGSLLDLDNPVMDAGWPRSGMGGMPNNPAPRVTQTNKIKLRIDIWVLGPSKLDRK